MPAAVLKQKVNSGVVIKHDSKRHKKE